MRHLSLDVVRGVAVMGILVANLPGFALPQAAYFSPRAWGGTNPADIAVWLATFVLVEGKMRGLFSFLFGASMLLVVDRAGDDAAAVHLRRMAALFAIGCVHLYLIWGSDILAHYALVGAFAYVFVRWPSPALLVAGLVLLGLQCLGAAAEARALWAASPETLSRLAWSFGMPPEAELHAELAAYRGGWWTQVEWRQGRLASPVIGLFANGVETLSAMLLGMAAYRSGFLTGAWDRARYRRWAALCLGVALPGYLALGLATIAHGFDPRWVFLGSVGASAPLRTLGFVGCAALLILLVRPGGWWTGRVAAVGQAAVTNYLATSIAMTFVFYGWGLGQFGRWSRAELYWLVPPAWAAMLAWAAPWFARFRHGPVEWAWRSLARLRPQPFRR